MDVSNSNVSGYTYNNRIKELSIGLSNNKSKLPNVEVVSNNSSQFN